MSTLLPPTTTLPTLSPSAAASILDTLFEHSSDLHSLSLPTLAATPPYPSYPALIAAINAQLTALLASPSAADAELLVSILAAHPRLGAKKVDSAQSRAEQAQLAGDPDEAAKLAVLNEAYEAAFPGLRYVVFVNGRSRPEIMSDMQHRIDTSTLEQEKADTIQAMCDIACDRAKKLGS